MRGGRDRSRHGSVERLVLGHLGRKTGAHVARPSPPSIGRPWPGGSRAHTVLTWSLRCGFRAEAGALTAGVGAPPV